MTSMFQSLWSGALRPFSQRPAAQQVAALCHRDGKQGREVLLVTSSRGRWILPKGWPINGLTDAQAAKQEAWEEAGVKKGKVADAPLGRFVSEKMNGDGAVIPCDVQVYPLAVSRMTKDFPEVNKRDRIWVSPQKAAKMVEDKGLKALLKRF